MRPQQRDPEADIAALPIWSGPLRIEPLAGGITNRNYRVKDSAKTAVVRFGGDLPLHGVMRFNEYAASRAAGEAGIGPQVLYTAPETLVLSFIEGRTYGPQDVRARADSCLALTRRAHREIADYLRGPTLAFNVFHIIRNYARTLIEDQSRLAQQAQHFIAVARQLEDAVGPVELVFGHNDLLAANFLDDGKRLWLIDWEYAGWTSPLFDLAGLASNNEFARGEQDALLESYFGQPATDALRLRFQAMLAAATLRETLWSLTQETRSTLDFDYVEYTAQNMRRFEAAWALFKEMQRG